MTTQTVFLPASATSLSIDVTLYQNAGATSPGNPLTGLVYNTASLTCYYGGGTTASTAVTLATQTATGAYSSGGFVARDATNMPGVYRFDIPNSLIPQTGEINFVFNGAANLATHLVKVVTLQQFMTAQMVESYASLHGVATPAQALFAIQQILTDFSWSGTTLTVTKADGSTTAMTFTANSSSNASSLTRAS